VTITTSSKRREQISAFYACHATRLQELVCRRADVPEQTIEDACQHAWTILIRRPDIRLDANGLDWLATVAIHEAWHRAAAPEIPSGGFQGTARGDDRDRSEPPAHGDRSAEDRALDRIEHQERLHMVATLKTREREALFLQGLGYSYDEIARLSRAARVVDASRAAPARR
jgi:DNA-directed RNA polymerase specialized sigma24 family protein